MTDSSLQPNLLPATSDDIERVHVVFKTHLDLGFTDFASSVLNRYLTDFMPQALRLARTLRASGSEHRFVWTTGAWLIDTFLEQADSAARRSMEEAITAGDIVWHALPFTTHSELLDPDLFRFGLSIAQRLDKRFGRKTIAAKMTDVPGHTRGIVPLLAETGVEFLHIGINEASPMPQVPPLFVWHDLASDRSVIVMYHGNYGDEMIAPGLRSVLAMTLTGDNLGPQNEETVRRRFQGLRQRYPNAQVTVSTMDAYARELREVRGHLPVVTAEIGDTWIHGGGTDPVKVRHFRALSRLRRQWVRDCLLNDEHDLAARTFSSNLLCVAEHTWGMDTKLQLLPGGYPPVLASDGSDGYAADYTPEGFARTRHEAHFETLRASWEEQRRYLRQAVESLAGTPLHEAALAVLRSESASPDPHPDPRFASAITAQRRIETPQFDFAFDGETGAIAHLRSRRDGRVWADAAHMLGLLRYETFSGADYDRFWQQYIRNANRADVRLWAQYDYMKPGLGTQSETNRLVPYHVTGMWMTHASAATRCTITLESRPDLATRYGAPPAAWLHYAFPHDQAAIRIQVGWQHKPATRVPEAGWLSFSPVENDASVWAIEKMGCWIDPLDVVSKGNRRLHAVGERLYYRDTLAGLVVASQDAPLVSLGQPGLVRFEDELPDMAGGVHFNLFNNVWNTNFPLWIEGSAVYDFTLEFA